MSDERSFDAEFFLDPVCPWCWVTSRWVVNVQHERHHRVEWRFITLDIVNEHIERDDGHRAAHFAGRQALRVADEVRRRHGNDGVASFYTALGTALHNDRRRDELTADPVTFLADSLATAGLDPSLAEHAEDESHDAALRAETEVALARTGPDVGTPILTVAPGTAAEGSFFGPVIPKAPTGADAVRLWDAVEVLAASGVAELKRSLRGTIDFT